MRRQSKKRAIRSRSAKARRENYRAEHGMKCMVCGSAGTDVHEISSGTAGRPLSEGEPATWLLACWRCNCGPLTDKLEWPVARQLALKFIADGKHFDLERFNACYTLGSVGMEDIRQWLTVR